VDEFQDTNKIQFDILIHLINKREQNVFVVGDPDQTIYT
jgi:DNA helicase-2/ATP-dependent DNA helicase PcrA